MTVKQTQTWEGNNTKLLVRIIISTFVPFPIIIFVIYKKEEKKICSFISLNSTLAGMQTFYLVLYRTLFPGNSVLFCGRVSRVCDGASQHRNQND